VSVSVGGLAQRVQVRHLGPHRITLGGDHHLCIASLIYFSPERPVLGPMTLTIDVRVKKEYRR
jgi:hypothetical protein